MDSPAVRSKGRSAAGLPGNARGDSADRQFATRGLRVRLPVALQPQSMRHEGGRAIVAPPQCTLSHARSLKASSSVGFSSLSERGMGDLNAGASSKGAGMRRRDKRRRLKKASAGNNTTLETKTPAEREGRKSPGRLPPRGVTTLRTGASQPGSPTDEDSISKSGTLRRERRPSHSALLRGEQAPPSDGHGRRDSRCGHAVGRSPQILADPAPPGQAVRAGRPASEEES